MIVTFDFDLNLKLPQPADSDKEYPDANMKVIESFRKHMKRGDEIYIVTSRSYTRKSLEEIINFLRKYNLKAKDIIHTNGDSKAYTLKELGSQLHYDDDPDELKDAQKVGVEGVYTYNDEAEIAFERWMNSL
jgi:acid phosphatase class B